METVKLGKLIAERDKIALHDGCKAVVYMARACIDLAHSLTWLGSIDSVPSGRAVALRGIDNLMQGLGDLLNNLDAVEGLDMEATKEAFALMAVALGKGDPLDDVE